MKNRTQRAGNSLRPSVASDDVRVLNNLPGRYQTEDLTARYWNVTPEGQLEQRTAVLQLPEGWSRACAVIPIGYPGCVQYVRRWGVALYPSLLDEIGFDPATILPEGEASNSGDLLRVMLEVTHFDLPGDFVIASREHPFLLYDPEGVLRGSFVRWRTYLGALTYMVTQGDVNASFLQLADEAPETYQEALTYIQDAVQTRASSNGR